MNSKELLIDDFIKFIANKWLGEFPHCFELPKHHPVWREWRENFNYLPNSTNRWHCQNLCQAFERYSWDNSSGDSSIEDAKKKLLDAISIKSVEDVRSACLKIFKWGGVAKKNNDASLLWINKVGGDLPQKIINAVTLLKNDKSDLSEFDGRNLLMNSAMTKVYWAADPDKELIIYDGRVGAAMGLLAREFLKSIKFTTVPDELKFRWGGSRDDHVRGLPNKRNPSEGDLRFPSLFISSKKDFHHAQMMRDSSLLLKEVAKLLKNVSVHDLEKALFMIGYDVRDFPQLKS